MHPKLLLGNLFLIFLIWDLEGTTLRRLTAGLTITLPGDPLRFAGHGRLDVPGCGDWEGVSTLSTLLVFL